MANEEIIINETEQNDAQMYIDQINALKQNSVSREKYDKLMSENKSLLESLVNGSGAEKAEPEQEVDIGAMRNELFCGKEMNNLEYCTKALALREAILEKEGRDIFVGQGHNLAPTPEAYASAQRVASVMQECIDASNGSSEIFTAELMRRTNEISLPRRK